MMQHVVVIITLALLLRPVVVVDASLLCDLFPASCAPPPCTFCAGDAIPTTTTGVDDTTTIVFGDDITCGSLRDDIIPAAGGIPEDLCFGYQELTAASCGCPDRPDNADGLFCTLCEDGSVPPALDAVTFDFAADDRSVTCCELLVGAATLELGNECTQTQDAGYSNCLCPITPEVATGCTMCSGGTLPDPDKEIIPLITCGGIDRFMGTLGDEDNACVVYQTLYAPFCDCPGAGEIATEDPSVCRVCGAGTVPTFPAAAADLSFFGVSMVPCAFAKTIMNQDTFTPRFLYQRFYEDVCCGESNLFTFFFAGILRPIYGGILGFLDGLGL